MDRRQFWPWPGPVGCGPTLFNIISVWKQMIKTGKNFHITLPYTMTLHFPIKLNTLPYYPHSSGPLQWGSSNCALKRSVAAHPDVLRWKKEFAHQLLRYDDCPMTQHPYVQLTQQQLEAEMKYTLREMRGVVWQSIRHAWQRGHRMVWLRRVCQCSITPTASSRIGDGPAHSLSQL